MSQKNRTEFIRVIKNRNYTVLNNVFLKRKDLSWKAKGILAYILSLPDDWNINLNEVMRNATEGERAFRSGWRELEELGYVKRQPVRQGNRIKYWETIVRESVDMKGKSELCGFEDVQNEDVRNEDVQNSKLLSTNSTKYLNKQSTNNPAKAERIPYKEIIDYLNDKAGRSFNHSAKGNKDLIKARWNEGYNLDDFKQAIDNKVAHANDPNHFFTEEYLRPSTLFRPSNFDEYVNSVVKSKKAKVSNDDSVNFDELSELLGEANE